VPVSDSQTQNTTGQPTAGVDPDSGAGDSPSPNSGRICFICSAQAQSENSFLPELLDPDVKAEEDKTEEILVTARNLARPDYTFEVSRPTEEGNAEIQRLLLQGEAAKLKICAGTDCSEIADRLAQADFHAGAIFRVTPPPGGSLTLQEYGEEAGPFSYHEVYVSGGYAFDPRFSAEAVPAETYFGNILNANPGAQIQFVPRPFTYP
jgi:hypothetical protein